MPWILTTPEPKDIAIPASKDIVRYRLDSFSFSMDEDSGIVDGSFVWTELWHDGSSHVRANSHSAQLTDLVSYLVGNTTETKRNKVIEEMVWEILNDAGLLSEGSWSG